MLFFNKKRNIPNKDSCVVCGGDLDNARKRFSNPIICGSNNCNNDYFIRRRVAADKDLNLNKEIKNAIYYSLLTRGRTYLRIKNIDCQLSFGGSEIKYEYNQFILESELSVDYEQIKDDQRLFFHANMYCSCNIHIDAEKNSLNNSLALFDNQAVFPPQKIHECSFNADLHVNKEIADQLLKQINMWHTEERGAVLYLDFHNQKLDKFMNKDGDFKEEIKIRDWGLNISRPADDYKYYYGIAYKGVEKRGSSED
jgi:hypothetical protein